MEHKIQFTIGSAFKGEGFKQSVQATKELSIGVRKAAGVAGALAGAFGSMDTKFSKAASAIAGLMSALATGNPIIIATTAAVTGLTFVVSKYKETVEGAAKKALELNEAWHKKMYSETDSDLNLVMKQIQDISDEFDRVTKQADAFKKAMLGVTSAEGAARLINIETEKFNAMLNATTEEAKAIIEQEYAVKIALEKKAQALDSANLKTMQVQAKIDEAEEQIYNAEQAQIKLMKERNEIELKISMLADNDQKGREELNKRLQTISDAYKKQSEIITSANDNIDILEKNLQAAKIEATNVENAQTLEVRKSGQKLEDLKKQQAEAIKEAADEQKKSNEKTKVEDNSLSIAKQNLTDQLNAASAAAQAMANNIQAMLGIQLGFGGTFVGQNGTDWAKNAGALGAADMQSVGAAGAKGATDSKSAHQAQMAAERAYRDGQSSALTNQYARDDRELDRLSQRSYKSLSEQQRERLRQLREQKQLRDQLKDKAGGGVAALNADDAIPNKIQELKEAIENLTLKE